MSDYEYDIDNDFPLFSAVNNACVVEKSTKPDSEEYSRKLCEIVEALQISDLTCIEVESRWHRGQAAIGALRGKGHIINTAKGKYHYVGFRDDMVHTGKLQGMYYETSHWKQKARERKDFDGNRCVQCRSTEDLETHHWRYDLFNEDLDELSTLCKRCHENMHTLTKGSGVHFPRYITEAIAERIRNNE